MTAVSNASPLIASAKIGRLDLLRDIFDEVYIPPTPARDIYAPGATLGAGEAAAIALARELDVTVILDDRAARRAAVQLEVACVGSAGVAIRAKQQGLLPEARPLLQQLRVARLRLSAATYDELLRLAGERPALR